jgi:hypothetical protein
MGFGRLPAMVVSNIASSAQVLAHHDTRQVGCQP